MTSSAYDPNVDLHGATLDRRPLSHRLWAVLARRSVRGNPQIALGLLDGLMVVLAYAVLLLARHDLQVPAAAWTDFRAFVPWAVFVHLVVNRAFGLYGPVWRHASMREAQQIATAGMASAVTLTLLVLVLPRYVPLTVAMLGGLAATVLFGIVRFQSRLFAFQRRAVVDGTRVVFVGGGDAAAAILREVGRHERPSIHPVAIVDDDPKKLGRMINGVPVDGMTRDLREVAEKSGAEQLLLAVPSATSELIQSVADVAGDLGLPMKVLPSVAELVNGSARLRDVRDLSIDDILGRQQIVTDLDSVHELLAGKRVLITGGGGSIGSELARQVSTFAPARLVILDRDETHLFDSAARVTGPCEQVLADVLDAEQLRRVFNEVRPDVVFHAAAHKHVPLLEAHPCQAAVNVLGTANVIDVARAVGVARLVFISTDKAVRPANAMGASKRIGEQMVLTGRPEGAAWSAVRFGNVLGSRGSVVPTFMRQISQGGPVTVTDEKMTRFFMSIPEAVQLVLQSSALSEGGEIFMLDMGRPVRILDLAKRMITLAGHRPNVDIDIEITGLRPGEKLAEELSTPEEGGCDTAHPSVRRLDPPLLPHDRLATGHQALVKAVREQDDEMARSMLFALALDQDRAVLHDDTADLTIIIDLTRQEAPTS